MKRVKGEEKKKKNKKTTKFPDVSLQWVLVQREPLVSRKRATEKKQAKFTRHWEPSRWLVPHAFRPPYINARPHIAACRFPSSQRGLGAVFPFRRPGSFETCGSPSFAYLLVPTRAKPSRQQRR